MRYIIGFTASLAATALVFWAMYAAEKSRRENPPNDLWKPHLVIEYVER